MTNQSAKIGLSLRAAKGRSNLDYSRIGDCHALTLFGLAMTLTFYILILEFSRDTLHKIRDTRKYGR